MRDKKNALTNSAKLAGAKETGPTYQSEPHPRRLVKRFLITFSPAGKTPYH